jgi:Ca2+-transporting ATPase
MTLVTLTFASAMFTVILSRLSSHMSRLMVVITLVVTLVLVQTPSLASLLHVTPLHADDLALGVAGALAVAALAMLGRFGRER